jgi:hypothetical protein
LKNNNLPTKMTLPVPAVAFSKPKAINYELTSSQTSCWLPKNSCERKKFYKENTTAETGNGGEQTQGRELRAHMLTFKL